MQMPCLALSLLQKSREWEYEQEWRIISYACTPNAKVHYSKAEPDSIYLGLRMQADERDRAIEVARKHGWRVYQMKVSRVSRDWTLEAEELSSA